jgi:hypothetical protein
MKGNDETSQGMGKFIDGMNLHTNSSAHTLSKDF